MWRKRTWYRTAALLGALARFASRCTRIRLVELLPVFRFLKYPRPGRMQQGHKPGVEVEVLRPEVADGRVLCGAPVEGPSGTAAAGSVERVGCKEPGAVVFGLLQIKPDHAIEDRWPRGLSGRG